MINRLHLFRNVGQFDSVDAAAAIPLRRLVLIYAENGRGKTTLAAILRSLSTGDPIPIIERRRLAALHPPQIILDCIGGPPHAMFQDGAWNRSLPDVLVFDDIFVDQNVYSGLAVSPDQRQHLHDLILGARGVALNRRLQDLVARVEEHNRALRAKEDAIPVATRGAMNVDEFCALPERADIDAAIQDTERALAAATEQDSIRATQPFDVLRLPEFTVDTVVDILQRNLPDLDATAAAQVQAHLRRIGEDGEAWAADGMTRIPAPQEGFPQPCPFCEQDLVGSRIIAHYRAYFSDAYTDLKQAVADSLENIQALHSGEATAAFERTVRICSERRQYWSRFCDVPEIALDTAQIAASWGTARDAVIAALDAKQRAPLERAGLSVTARASIAAYEAHRQEIIALNQRLQDANIAIALVKERAAAGNRAAIAADLARLRAVIRKSHVKNVDTI